MPASARRSDDRESLVGTERLAPPSENRLSPATVCEDNVRRDTTKGLLDAFPPLSSFFDWLYCLMEWSASINCTQVNEKVRDSVPC